MNESVQLVIYETKSLPQGYKALEDMSESGLEPLEFYPHAQGVRITLRAPKGFTKPLPLGAVQMNVSTQVLKGLLSQTENILKKYLVVVETKSFVELLKLASEFEKIEAGILEIRSLRSNPEKNYGLFTLDEKDSAKNFLKSVEHSILSASSAVLKEFLGFS